MAELNLPRSCRMESPDGRLTKRVGGSINISTLLARGWRIMNQDGTPAKGMAIAEKGGEASVELHNIRKPYEDAMPPAVLIGVSDTGATMGDMREEVSQALDKLNEKPKTKRPRIKKEKP